MTQPITSHVETDLCATENFHKKMRRLLCFSVLWLACFASKVLSCSDVFPAHDNVVLSVVMFYLGLVAILIVLF